MDANQVIKVMGGRQAVMKITGLSKGRISQWITGNHIPVPWLAAFRAMRAAEFDRLDSASQDEAQADHPR
jgi:DNA-binding transcriptional regulator YdaS (Cro superfamily)